MRFSVYTPTHTVTFLRELRDSLAAQTFRDFEWMIFPNNGVTVADVLEVLGDVQFRTCVIGISGSGVGALKKAACSRCKGEYLVEIDSDDVVTDDALTKIDAAITATNADFLYSDCVEFRSDGTSHVYGKEYGWTYRQFEWRDNIFVVNEMFPLNARSMSEIYSAPNHIRCWRRETYEEIGGHDASLPVCDDFDLVIRTYLSRAKFHYIPECLYLYRISGGNTWLKRNAEIQTKQREIGDKYRYALIKEWCRREGLKMYDLGGAIGCPDGFTGVDLHAAPVTCDMRHGLPFEDDSVGCFRANDVLEHFDRCSGPDCAHSNGCYVGLLNAIYRCLIPGGWLITATPSALGRGAFQDPMHRSYWTPNNWFYFTRRQQQRYVQGIKAKFQAVRVAEGFPSSWEKDNFIPYVYADLVALKPDGPRLPGLVEI